MVKSKSLSGKILELVGGGVLTTLDVITAILESGHGASYSRMDIRLNQIKTGRANAEVRRHEQQRFYNTLSYLRRDGLIAKNEGGMWQITKNGRKKLLEIIEMRKTRIAKSSSRYLKKPCENYNLVIFDIPEDVKVKRDWLREVLINLGFKMLQKSVWIGRVVVPREFIKDLSELKILNYVHIFSVEKEGTIRGNE